MCWILSVRVVVMTDVNMYLLLLFCLFLFRDFFLIFSFIMFFWLIRCFSNIINSLTFVFDEMVAFHGLFPLRFFAPSCQNHLLNPQSKSPKKKRHIWDTQVL